MQSALRLIFPPRCLGCGALVEADFALCGECWRDAPFIAGARCDTCGAPLPGPAGPGAEVCDDCLKIARPWQAGRAAMVYTGTARKIVLALKHGDRTELARPAAGWMLRAGADVIRKDMIVAPVPLHWARLLRRRYNQAALLAQGVARGAGLCCCPDLLHRSRPTAALENAGREQRFAELAGAIRANPRRRREIAGKRFLLVDDVMTSGATLAAASEACLAAGAAGVTVLVLARVARDV